MNGDCVGEFVVGQVVVVLRQETARWGQNGLTAWNPRRMDQTVGHVGVVRQACPIRGIEVDFPERDFEKPWWYPAWVLSPVSAGAVAPEALSQMKW